MKRRKRGWGAGQKRKGRVKERGRWGLKAKVGGRNKQGLCLGIKGGRGGLRAKGAVGSKQREMEKQGYTWG